MEVLRSAFEKPPYCFPFTFLPAVFKGSFSPESLPFVVVWLLVVDWSEMKSQCHFDLHFLYGQVF
jgi:hypothetical protein